MRLFDAINKSRFGIAGCNIPGSKNIIIYDSRDEMPLRAQTKHRKHDWSTLAIMFDSKFEHIFGAIPEDFTGWKPIAPKPKE